MLKTAPRGCKEPGFKRSQPQGQCTLCSHSCLWFAVASLLPHWSPHLLHVPGPGAAAFPIAHGLHTACSACSEQAGDRHPREQFHRASQGVKTLAISRPSQVQEGSSVGDGERLCFFFFFFGYIHSLWKFPGQGLSLHHNSDPSCCSDNDGSLARCTTRELLCMFYGL